MAFADKHAGNFRMQMVSAAPLLRLGDFAAARRVLNGAAALVPFATGDASPWRMLVTTALRQDDAVAARRYMEKVLEMDHTGLSSCGNWSPGEGAEDMALRQRAAERLIEIDPFDAAAHTALGELALARQDVPVALRELQAAVDAGPANPAEALTSLAKRRCAAASGTRHAGTYQGPRNDAAPRAGAGAAVADHRRRAQRRRAGPMSRRPRRHRFRAHAIAAVAPWPSRCSHDGDSARLGPVRTGRRPALRRAALAVHPHPLRRAQRRFVPGPLLERFWAIDGPAAEQNLSRRIRSVTAIDVGEPVVVRIEDPELFNHPWIYFVEPGTLRLKESEVPILREFLLRGGTAVMDDFHGDFELDNVVTEMKRVFPDRKIIELPASHPIFRASTRWTAFRRCRGSDRSSPGGPGRRAASTPNCTPSRTTTAGPWCS